MIAKKPLVLGFGWLGSRNYNMHSFEKIYTKEGYDFKYMIQSPFSCLDMKPDTKKFNEMYELAKNREAICHIFSLNGAFAFLNSMKQNDYKEFKPNLKIKGIIWDSAPGRGAGDKYYKPFARAIANRSEFMYHILRFALIPPFKFFYLFSQNHRRLRDMRINSMYTDPFPFKQLLIASKHDRVIKYKEMMEYVEIAKSRGIDISTKIYDDSDHVMLYHSHRDKYSRLILDFAKNCFQQ